MDTSHERWASGEVYEQFMGRWSREVAPLFLKWLDAAPHQCWLDVGCGTGVLTRAIVANAVPRAVVGLDPSLDFLQFAAQQTDAAHFMAADGRAFALADASFDAITSGLALNFIPQPEQGLQEMHRVAKPGGLVAAYVWDYADGMEFLRYFWDAAAALDAAAAPLHEGDRFRICQTDALQQLWQQTGLNDIRADAIEIPTVFDSFEAYWRCFTVGHFPAPKYVASLDESKRDRLRERLRTTVGSEDNGSIHLVARAWTISGYR